MSKKILALPPIAVALTLMMILVTWECALGAGPTTDPWPSFRHDLLNSGVAEGSGYPTTDATLWVRDREGRPDEPPPGSPAGARGPTVVDKGMVYTAGTGIIQANDQFDGTLVWSREFTWQAPTEPTGAPTDWCYNDIPAVEGNKGICYVADMGDCPSWCFECTTDEPTCPSLINPLPFPDGYAMFLTGPTVDASYGTKGAVIFGTFDGRAISLNMTDGSTIWEKTPYKDPGGPNVGKPWYHQKFGWHLNPPSIYDGKVYLGSFLPSFYAIFRPWGYVTPGQPGYPWPHIGNDAMNYWAGRDGWFYALDEDDGSIVWTWDPRG